MSAKKSVLQLNPGDVFVFPEQSESAGLSAKIRTVGMQLNAANDPIVVVSGEMLTGESDFMDFIWFALIDWEVMILS